MPKAVTVIGATHIAWGVMGIMIAFIISLILAGTGAMSGDEDAVWVTSLVALAVAIPLFLLSIPAIVGGIWLLRGRNWARILLIVMGVVDLLNIPFGTILGIFTIKYLLEPRIADLFRERRPVGQADPRLR